MYYELRFTSAAGKVFRGPVLGRKDAKKFHDLLGKMGDAADFKMTFHNEKTFIGGPALENGVVEIRRIWLPVALWRKWRA